MTVFEYIRFISVVRDVHATFMRRPASTSRWRRHSMSLRCQISTSNVD